MKPTRRSIGKIIDEQVGRWQILAREHRQEAASVPVITISREPGSGGGLIGRKLAERLGFDFFHQELLLDLAEASKVDRRIIETLDETGLNVLEHWISSLVDRRHLWPDEHLNYLMRVVGTIGKHGSAVILGRGANFILPKEERFRVRVVAPRDFRVRQMARDFNVSMEEARRRLLRTEAERKAFVYKYFYSDIADPVNYDLVINTATVSLDTAVEFICNGFTFWQNVEKRAA